MSDHEAQGRLAALPTRFGEPRGEVMLVNAHHPHLPLDLTGKG